MASSKAPEMLTNLNFLQNSNYEEVLENILDLDVSVKGSSDFLEFISGGKVTFGSVPLAHRHGERWELQLKGSGKTPYSRNGDGRAVLRSSVREFLCSEAMHYLGIPTSRAASLVVSDDAVWRDQFYNGNIKRERGVCNTDNFSLLSITIDYGPFGFMDSYDPNFVPNTSDDERRYKIGNQASVGLFNLSKLLQALKPLLDPRQKQLASQILEGYGEHYYSRFTELFKAKLGLLGENENDNYLIAFLLKIMEDTKADFTMTFRELSEITADQLKELHIPEEFWALQDLGKHKLFSEWVTMYLLRLNSNNGDSDAKRRTRMTSSAPGAGFTTPLSEAEGCRESRVLPVPPSLGQVSESQLLILRGIQTSEKNDQGQSSSLQIGRMDQATGTPPP
ncbi:selenoprotein O [Turdus rufiventris]|nr:selenoprotein O [Turdus rufiventris]